MLIKAFAVFALIALARATRQNKPDPNPGSSETSDDEAGGISSSVYDYVFVGGGDASISGAYFLAEALKKANKPISIIVLEKDDRLGGSVLDVDSLPPPNYNNSRAVFGKLPLKLGVGALRTNALAMNLKRDLIFQFNLTLVFTPFRNIIKQRGITTVCQNPIEKADGSADPYAFGDFCNNRAPYVDPTSEAADLASRFIGFSKLRDFAKGSPSDAFWKYVLYNVPHLTGEWDIDQRDGWKIGRDGYGRNPFSGLRCRCNDADLYVFDPSDPDMRPSDPLCTATEKTLPCPWELASGVDWRTFVERVTQVLEPNATMATPTTPPLNQNYSSFMIDDNVGFQWDYMNAYDALSQLYYNVFEWNTASINGYLPHGESSLTDAMVNAAKARGVQFKTSERVKSAQRAGFNALGAKYRIVTTSRTVYARKFLALNLPPFFLFPRQDDDPIVTYDGSDLNGDVIDDLRALPQVQAVANARTIKIVAQYQPGKRAWFWDLWDPVTGNYSVRQYGTDGCSSRIEILDTPRTRCTNEITIVYSDGLCRRKWQAAAKDMEENNDQTTMKQLVTEEAKSAFPWLAPNITLPLKVTYHMFNSAWHYNKWRFGEFSVDDVARKATTPLGTSERVSLIGEAYFKRRSGWREGAMRSAKRTIERIGSLDGFRSSVDFVYNATLKARPNADGTFGDGSGYDGNGDLSAHGYMPSAVPFADRNLSLIAANERFGPFGPYNNAAYEQDSCRPELYGIRGL